MISTGSSGNVLHVLRLGDHDDREAVPDTVEDHRYYNVSDGDRADWFLSPAYVLRGPRSPA